MAELGVDSYYSYIDNAWNNINVRSNVYPFPWLRASHTNTLTRDKGRPYATSEHSSRLLLFDPRGDTLSFGVEYYRPDAKLFTTGIQAKVTLNLIAGYEMKYDFIDHRFDSQTQTLTLQPPVLGSSGRKTRCGPR